VSEIPELKETILKLIEETRKENEKLTDYLMDYLMDYVSERRT